MTRKIAVLIVALLVLVGLLAAGGVVSAQGPGTPPAATPAWGGCGMMGGWSGSNSYGMMGRWGLDKSTLGIVAEKLGLSLDELTAKLRDGSTIADLAAAQNIPLDDLVQAVIAVRATALQDAVQAGRITQAQADLMLQRMTDMIEACFTSGPLGGFGAGMMGGRGGRTGGVGRGPMRGWGAGTADTL